MCNAQVDADAEADWGFMHAQADAQVEGGKQRLKPKKTRKRKNNAQVDAEVAALANAASGAEIAVHEALKERGLSQADEVKIAAQVSTLAGSMTNEDWNTVNEWMQAQVEKASPPHAQVEKASPPRNAQVDAKHCPAHAEALGWC